MITATLPTLEKLLAQLDDLAQLPPDWDRCGDHPPTPEAILAAKQLVLHLHDFNPSYLPHAVVPLPDGGVALEWADGPFTRQLSIEVTATGSAIAFLVDTTSGTRHTQAWVHALYRDLHHAIQTFLAP